VGKGFHRAAIAMELVGPK